MEKIPSFSKNHDLLPRGLHVAMEANGITTFDLRLKTPNGGEYITPKSLHTTEHLLATTLRNSREKDKIVYFGPMGCRTGYYLLTVGLRYGEVRSLLIESVKAALALDEIPGNKREECGNYLEHDLDGARADLKEYLSLLEEEK